MKIVINSCFGGFGLSHQAVMRYAELVGLKLYAFVDKHNPDGSFIPFSQKDRFEPYDGKSRAFIIYYATKPLENGTYPADSYFCADTISRNDKNLVKVVEELGNRANGRCAELEIVEIPDGTKWVIDEYDGLESVEEEHQSWS